MIIVLISVVTTFLVIISAQEPDCNIFEVEHGVVRTYPPGVTTAVITCDEYYHIKGHTAITCFKDNPTTFYRWNLDPGKCVKFYCESEEPLQKGPRRVISGLDRRFPDRVKAGYAVGFGCDPGYRLEGTQSIACWHEITKEVNFFSNDFPECVALCEVPEIENGRVSLSPDGIVATIKCNRNYVVGGNAAMTCINRGGRYEWDVTPGKCGVNYCSKVKRLQEGRRKILSGVDPSGLEADNVKVGDSITMGCQAGYKLQGSSVLTCVHRADGRNEFNAVPPTCTGCRKGSMTRPDFGWVQFTLDGSIATFKCKTGYRLNGPPTRICGASGEWSGPAPYCIRN